MPLPIIVFTAAQVTGEVAGTSIWIYLGGTALGGGGIYYYGDRIYNWWFPSPREVIYENYAYMNGIEEASKSLIEAQAVLEKTSETKASILKDVTQSLKKTDALMTEVYDLTLVEKETFESLLRKTIDAKVNTLDNILSMLEKIQDSLSFDEVRTIESIMRLVKENQFLRDVDAKKDKIILKLEKINTLLKEKLIASETDFKQEKNISNSL